MNAPRLDRAVETFARDLSLLLRSARLYPDGHPSIDRLTETLCQWPPLLERGRITLSVTRTELIWDNRFFGGKNRQSTALAGFLHARRIRALTVCDEVEPAHWLRFALVVADRKHTGGAPLVEAWETLGIDTITIEPLDLTLVHKALETGAGETVADPNTRGRQVWLWLQAANASPEETARALRSDDLWKAAQEDETEAFHLGYLLSGLGMRLEQGLDLLAEEERGDILGRLAEIGKKVSAERLRDILAQCPDPVLLQEEGMVAMLGDIEGDKILDVMAGLLAEEGIHSPRLSALLRRASPEQRDAELEVVRSRLAAHDHRGFTVEVWQNLEDLFLKVDDRPFVDTQYARTLDAMATLADEAFFLIGEEYAKSGEPHLDMIYLALALSVGGLSMTPWDELFDRLALRIQEGDVAEVLEFVEQIDHTVPHAMEGHPELLDQLFARGCAQSKQDQRELILGFRKLVKRHRKHLFKPLIDGMRDAETMRLRRFLVEVAVALPADMTPPLVTKARSGPWYLTRNLLIVLGYRRDPAALPFVRAMLASAQPKVRREALRALEKFGKREVETLRSFMAAPDVDPEDVALAAKLLERLS